MDKVTYLEFCQRFRFRDFLNWLRLPTHYIARSVEDYLQSRMKLKRNLGQRLSPALRDYAIILLHHVRLEEVLMEGVPVVSSNKAGEKATVYTISDRTAKTYVLWPERDNALLGCREAHQSRGLEGNDQVYGLVILHDLKFNNPFVYDVRKDNPAKQPRSLSELLNDLRTTGQAS